MAPYYIEKDNAGCAKGEWATTKGDGEVVGCHESKSAAIRQMVALSVAEGIEPGGERGGDD